MDARKRLPAPAHDHPVRGDRTIIIAFDLDPRDVDPERAYANYAFDSFHVSLVECALCAVPLSGYDSSLDDALESGFAYQDVPLLVQAVGRVGQVLAAATVLCDDAVGAAGGGQLAWVATVGLALALAASNDATVALTNCSTVHLAGGHCFAGVPSGALLEEEVLHWGTENYGPSIRYTGLKW
jgi:hypothetical protein